MIHQASDGPRLLADLELIRGAPLQGNDVRVGPNGEAKGCVATSMRCKEPHETCASWEQVNMGIFISTPIFQLAWPSGSRACCRRTEHQKLQSERRSKSPVSNSSAQVLVRAYATGCSLRNHPGRGACLRFAVPSVRPLSQNAPVANLV